MILICERCFSPIAPGEDYVRLAHLERAYNDGSVEWIHSYVHTEVCGRRTAPPRSPGERPDTGSWDPSRRGLSPAAAQWCATPAARNAPRTSRVSQ
ncbi:hypothetical protein [Pseudonocardia acidicola]|uniref:Uncharacterized protein n=1 Tax=Pseudonocardia acidicola TaxID=2724939 RepID=A0ABX1S9B6_9PSEU|nr:hypothetical protein [Pseudonocardia acidicola]NMH97053.1 hypothetical protein [Pseudonocardia acidicola]